MHRELAPYMLVSVLTLLIAALATTSAAAVAPGGRRLQTVFVSIAYLATYGSLFVAKYSVYQRFVFRSAEGP